MQVIKLPIEYCFTQTSTSMLVNGIALLERLIHPQLFIIPTRLQHKYQPFYSNTHCYATT